MGTGTILDPWTSEEASHPATHVPPYSRVNLRAGVYPTNVVVAHPDVTWQSYPLETAIIDATAYDDLTNAVVPSAENVTVRDLLIRHTGADREVGRAGGVLLAGRGSRAINLLVMDAGPAAVGSFDANLGGLIYGIVALNYGWQEPEGGYWTDGTGTGLYVQNPPGAPQKVIRHNIFLNNYGYGVHAYTEQGSVRNLLIEGNISTGNAALTVRAEGTWSQRHFGILVWGGAIKLDQIAVRRNYLYEPPSEHSPTSNVGRKTGDTGVTYEHNVACSYSGLYFNRLDSLIGSNNTVYAEGSQIVAGERGPVTFTSWDNNHYYGADSFWLNGVTMDFATWKATTGMDANSTLTAGHPPDAAYVEPNEYEVGRANIAVYNWSAATTAEADLSDVLDPGDPFYVFDALNPLAGAVASGTFGGTTIDLPMTGLIAATPAGWVAPPPHSAPEFGTFVVRKCNVPPGGAPAAADRLSA